jgi:serine/threonine protein kinase
MAPELIFSLPYGPAVDVFSFGVVLWEIATRQMPWSDLASVFAIENAVTTGQRLSLTVSETAPAAWIQLVNICWAGDAAARPSFLAIGVMLEQIAAVIQ